MTIASPSLSISAGKDGKVLVRCHAGCDQRDVIAALSERGLWDATGKRPGRIAHKRRKDLAAEPDPEADGAHGGRAGDLAGIARHRGHAGRNLSASRGHHAFAAADVCASIPA